MPQELDEVKYQTAVANRILAEFGLASGVLASLGHASMRVPNDPEKFAIKGRGYAMDAIPVIRPEDMIVCDLEGYKIDGPVGAGQCYEVKMHSCIYKTHPEVQSVVHVHPRFTIIMGLLGARIYPMCNEGNQLVRHPLPMFPHQRLILTEEDGMEVAGLLGTQRAVLLRGHGAATVGGSLEESVMNMIHLEEQSKMNYYAYCAEGRDHGHVPDEDIEDFVQNSARMAELPHLKGPLAQARRVGSAAAAGGVWTYYFDMVSKRMDSNR